MTDTTTTDAVLSDEQLDYIASRLGKQVKGYEGLIRGMPDEKVQFYRNNGIYHLAVQVVDSHRTLQSRLDQAHWDAISRDQTIETLRAENARYREALEFYACDDTYLPVMEGDGTPITGTVVVLHDGGHIARVALGYEEETWFNPRDAAYPDRFIAHAQSDIPALLKTIAELREVVAMIVVDTANSDIGDDHFVSSELIERARAVLARMEGTP